MVQVYNIKVTILILIDGFLQFIFDGGVVSMINVTILILIDGFLQFMHICLRKIWMRSHNPYFNRWFSAI